MRSIQVVVLGGGASGMMAALTAARRGKKVMIIERMNRLGKKLLATGNGRCNYTNACQELSCYRGNPEFIRKSLELFPMEKTIAFFHEIGILPKCRNGYYYPHSEQASSVLEAFERELSQQRAEIHLQEQVKALYRHKSGWVVETDRDRYLAQSVVASFGGMAAPVHGTQGDGYSLLGKLGHQIVPVVPALTSCVLKGDFTKEWAGVRTQGEIAVYTGDGMRTASDRGELQMVAYGISGIPVFQISRFVARLLLQGERPYLIMDIMPEYTEEEIRQELLFRRNRLADRKAGQALEGMLHKKLACVLLQQAGLKSDSRAGDWTDAQLQKITQRLKSWKLGVSEVSGFDRAQVSCGGVCTEQIDAATMQSKLCPGLYVTGELLDVDGICGGYNLQWAWTSGYLAGSNVL